MISAPTGHGELLKKAHTLPSSTTLLKCRLTAPTSGNAFEVKNVADVRESCSTSSGLIGWRGPGVICGLGSKVEHSSSPNEDAHPIGQSFQYST